MSFKCEICCKVFNTNQHLNQHKNRKKPCQKINEINNNKTNLNNEDNLEFINLHNVLIEENNHLKNTIAELQKDLFNIELKRQLLKDFIKYVVNNDDIDEEILKNISMLLSNASKQKNKQTIEFIMNKYKRSNHYKANNYHNNIINSSDNSIISDLTNTPPTPVSFTDKHDI